MEIRRKQGVHANFLEVVFQPVNHEYDTLGAHLKPSSATLPKHGVGRIHHVILIFLYN